MVFNNDPCKMKACLRRWLVRNALMYSAGLAALELFFIGEMAVFGTWNRRQWDAGVMAFLALVLIICLIIGRRKAALCYVWYTVEIFPRAAKEQGECEYGEESEEELLDEIAVSEYLCEFGRRGISLKTETRITRIPFREIRKVEEVSKNLWRIHFDSTSIYLSEYLESLDLVIAMIGVFRGAKRLPPGGSDS